MKNSLLSLIEEKMPAFSKGQRAIATYLLENYDKVAYMTASKLGGIVGVSESTVVRFAIELGFDGYPDMQRSLQELIRMRLTSVQRMDVTDLLIGDGDVLDKVLSSDIEKLRYTLECVDRGAFDAATDALIRAKHIYIMGVRSSSVLARFLNFNLRMIFDDVKLVQTTSGSEMFEQIHHIGEGDVLVAISFPRYSKRIIKAVEYAKEVGAQVISITDSDRSPIAPLADQLLIARSDMVSFVDSLVAPLSIINAMIVSVARKDPATVRAKLQKLEQIWEEYEVYDTASN
ncbi:MAG: MurR/RpiR family transcriptional regulator [Clostridia bacterium]|nr:MurR/RpiR family transcriptional regulator [Clostridia bacterium]